MLILVLGLPILWQKAMADQQDSGARLRDWDRFGPGKVGQACAGLILLGRADQQGQATGRCD
jgi:hypothetical protein